MILAKAGSGAWIINMHSPIEILKQNNIRGTGCREGILEEFQRFDHALSQPDLEKALGKEFDRVTIYRTLSLFLEKGIIHSVLDDAGATKYALCPDVCSHEGHQHEHVHFKCTNCDKTICLDELGIPSFVLPAGFQLEEANLLLKGL